MSATSTDRPRGPSFSGGSQNRRRLCEPPLNEARPVLCCLRWGLLALLAGYLLFAHGCHGDEDNELFAWLEQQVAAPVGR